MRKRLMQIVRHVLGLESPQPPPMSSEQLAVAARQERIRQRQRAFATELDGAVIAYRRRPR